MLNCSGMLVQDPTNRYDADAIFDHAKNSGSVVPTDRPSSSSRSFTGTARLLSGESVNVSAQPPESVTHTITLWRNGFTVNDGPLQRFDDPANASFLEVLSNLSFALLDFLESSYAARQLCFHE